MGYHAIRCASFCPESTPLISYELHATASNFFGGSKPKAAAPELVKSGDAPTIDSRLLPPVNVELGWRLGQRVDMHVYLTTSPNGDIFNKDWMSGRDNDDKNLPNFIWENLTFGNWKDTRTMETDVKFPEVSVSLYACNAIHFAFPPR